MENSGKDASGISLGDAVRNFESFSRVRELQGQLAVINEQASKTASKIFALNVAMKEAEAGIALLDSVGEDPSNRTFRQVARMFVLESPTDLRQHVVKEKEEKNGELSKLQSFQKSLEAKQRELLSS